MWSLLLMVAVPQAVDADTDVMCVARPAEVLVGEHYRRGVPTRAKRLSGAPTVRVIMPGTKTPMDFRTDRLTIRIDHRRMITSVDCG